MGTIHLQTASEFELSKLPITHHDVDDIIKVRKNCATVEPNVLGKYTNIPKRKWLEWERNGLVSFGSGDLLDSDGQGDRCEKALNVKLERQGAELQLERERRLKAEHELEEHLKQKKLLDAIPSDGIYTPRLGTFKDKIASTQQMDHANTRGRKTYRHTRHYSSSDSDQSSSRSSSSSISSDSDMREPKHRRHKHKSRSPTSKMSTFSGDGKISWDTFITQFERLAERHEWGKRKKSDKLLSCLEGLALEYVCKLKLDKYRDIKKEMSRRFNTKDNPISARRKLQYIRQHEDERLQEFAQRVHFITIDGYSESGRKAIDQISTESFLRGCRDKEAARSVMEKNPKNIHEALDLIKASIANQQAVYGSSKAYYHRQVSFAPSEQHTDTDHGENKFSIQQKKIEQLEEKITKLTDMVFCMKETIDERLPVNRFPNNTQQFQSRPRSPSPYRFYDRQNAQNTKPYQSFSRSLSPLRSNPRSPAGSPFRSTTNKPQGPTNSPKMVQDLNSVQPA